MDDINTVDACQFIAENRNAARPNLDVEQAAVRVTLSFDARIFILDGLHDVAREVGSVGNGEGCHEMGLHDSGIENRFLSRGSVCFYESTDAKFDPTEIANNGDEGPMQIVRAQDAVNGGAGTAGGLAIIGSPETIRSKLPCEADVTRRVVFNFDRFKVLGHGSFRRVLIGKRKRERVTVKLAPFGLEQTRTRSCQGGESVTHDQLTGLRLTLYTCTVCGSLPAKNLSSAMRMLPALK